MLTWPVHAPSVPHGTGPVQTFPESHVYESNEVSTQVVSNLLSVYESKPHALYLTVVTTYETAPGALSTQKSQAKFVSPFDTGLLERFFHDSLCSKDPQALTDEKPVSKKVPLPEELGYQRPL